MKQGEAKNVRDLALGVIESNGSAYGEDLLTLIPDRLLGLSLSDGNREFASMELNVLRLNKEKDPGHRKRETVERELKFLFNVASALDHW